MLLTLAVILVVAKLGGDLATRVGQPAVLGELVVGVVLGNVGLRHWAGDPSLMLLAELGVILLLFEVGLESTVGDMLKVGVTALIVALTGVMVPFGLGWAAGHFLLPDHSIYMHTFLGATLAATSVGITARVLQDLGRGKSAEARVILGAAVIDDVLGLVMLAVVSGVVVAADQGRAVAPGGTALIVGKAAGFLVGALVLGVWLSPRLFKLASGLQARGVLLALAMAFCFGLAYAAHAVELAPIVGAFAAGLILEDTHFQDFQGREPPLEELVHPLTSVLTPVFFVTMGMKTDVTVFGQPGVAALAGALIACAIVGKLVCGLVVPRGLNRLAIGVGMVPRGEVGLIFASMGLALTVKGEHIVDATTYSAIVAMVIVTTLITPPALKQVLGRA